MSNDYAGQLKSAILSKDEGTLIDFQKSLDQGPEPLELFAALDFSDEQRDELAKDPEWMARVYEAFASSGADDVEPAEELSDERHLEYIGRAFANVLLPGLPDQLRDLEKYPSVAELALVDDAEFEELAVQADVQAAGDVGLFLARRGLSPLSFQLATEEIGVFLEDLRDDGALAVPEDAPVRLYRDACDGVRSDGVDFHEAAMEIARAASLDLPRNPDEERQYKRLQEIPLPRSSFILNWLVDASLSKPFLFRGLIAQSAQRDLLLWPFSPIDDCETRWKISANSALPKDDLVDLFKQRFGIRIQDLLKKRRQELVLQFESIEQDLIKLKEQELIERTLASLDRGRIGEAAKLLSITNITLLRKRKEEQWK